MKGYYTIRQARDGQYYFVLYAGNNQSLLSSELYTTKTACELGIDAVQKNSQYEEFFTIKTAKNGKPYFTLRARNHQEIGRSEMYISDAACSNGIASVVKNGGTEEIRNDT